MSDIRDIPLDQIQVDGTTQMRVAGIDPAVVIDYADAIFARSRAAGFSIAHNFPPAAHSSLRPRDWRHTVVNTAHSGKRKTEI